MAAGGSAALCFTGSSMEHGNSVCLRLCHEFHAVSKSPPPPKTSPVSFLRAAAAVGAPSARGVADSALSCSLSCGQKTDDEGPEEACTGETRVAGESPAAGPRTQPGAMRITAAEWERVLQTHRIKVEELTDLMHVRGKEAQVYPVPTEGFG